MFNRSKSMKKMFVDITAVIIQKNVYICIPGTGGCAGWELDMLVTQRRPQY